MIERLKFRIDCFKVLMRTEWNVIKFEEQRKYVQFKFFYFIFDKELEKKLFKIIGKIYLLN